MLKVQQNLLLVITLRTLSGPHRRVEVWRDPMTPSKVSTVLVFTSRRTATPIHPSWESVFATLADEGFLSKDENETFTTYRLSILGELTLRTSRRIEAGLRVDDLKCEKTRGAR